MITAIDTNVLLDILVPNEQFYDASARALEDAASAGSLVISDIVYAELCIHFEIQRDCDAFLESNQIRGRQCRNVARSCEQGQQFGKSQAMRLGRRRQNAAAGRRFAARAFLWRGRRWLILLRAMRAAGNCGRSQCRPRIRNRPQDAAAQAGPDPDCQCQITDKSSAEHCVPVPMIPSDNAR